MGIRPVFLVALTCAVLALAAFVTSTSDGAVWSSGSGAPLLDGEEVDPGCRPGADCSDRGEEPDQGAPIVIVELPDWAMPVLYVPLIALAALAVLIIARRLRLVRRRRQERAATRAREPAPPSPPTPTEEAEELGAELVRQAAALDDGEPRNAIVASWVALEQAAARAGVVPDRTETPTEFARRAATAYRLHEAALDSLADLYREARFSRHELTPAHIEEARRCLTTLAHDLRVGVPGGGAR